MNNYNETSKRIPLRAQRAAHRSAKNNRSYLSRSGFIVRFNICLTIIAALLLLSKINTGLTDRLTEGVSAAISETASFSEMTDKIKNICLSLTSSDTDVFSEDSGDIDKTITKQIEQNKLMEEQLKNR